MCELFIKLVVILIGLGIVGSLIGAAVAYYDYRKAKKVLKDLKRGKNE